MDGSHLARPGVEGRSPLETLVAQRIGRRAAAMPE
jgi:hypothetical protein